MQRLVYRVYLDLEDGADAEQARRALEDALETLAVPGDVTYAHLGTGLPERDPCGAADRFSCVCRTESQEPGLPQGVYRTGADL